MKIRLDLLLGVTLAATFASSSVLAQSIIVPSTQTNDPTLGTYAGNYHVLTNGMDGLYVGVGAGGSATDDDGLGTWIPGEELKGNTRASTGDPFSYKMTGFRESVCVLDSSSTTIEFPDIAWIEFDGRNGHCPDVFTNPWDSACLCNLGIGGAPYGVPPSSTDSFLLTLPPTGSGLDPAWPVLIPNEGILPASGGAGTFIAGFNNISLPITGTGCWDVQFELISSVASGDDIDGWWHYARNAASNGQYWGMSNDELNLHHSFTVGTTAGATGLQTFFANVDYCLMPLSRDPTTHAALAPVGFNGAGPYYSTVTTGNPNGGFDLGRGSQMYSQSGVCGYANPYTGLGNQDPAGAAILGLLPGVSFVTFDNTDYDGDGDIITTPPTGSNRLTWVKFDWDVSVCIDPSIATDLGPFWGGLVRGPVQVPFFGGGICPQPITTILWPLYVHSPVNRDGDPSWPDPGGHPAGSFGTPTVAAESLWIPLDFGPLCFGFPIALEYGSSGMVTPTGPPTWNPNIGRVSGTRQLFLWE